MTTPTPIDLDDLVALVTAGDSLPDEHLGSGTLKLVVSHANRDPTATLDLNYVDDVIYPALETPVEEDEPAPYSIRIESGLTRVTESNPRVSEIVSTEALANSDSDDSELSARQARILAAARADPSQRLSTLATTADASTEYTRRTLTRLLTSKPA